MMLHPRFSVLVDFADDELSSRKRARVKAHLAECTRCRKELTAIRVVKAKTQAAYSSGPVPQVLDEVLERYAAGERTILPSADPPAQAPGHRRMLGAAAAVALLVAAGTVFGIRGARAGHSELIFDPPQPKRGDTIQVEYRATSWLGAEDRLVLRARYRRPQDPQYNRSMQQLVVTELERVRTGVYRSSFVLPDSVVYAVFAVEDTAARRVDSNGRRLWELMVHRDTVPEFEGLVQKWHDLMGRDWEGAFGTARLATELYPDEPRGWADLGGFEVNIAGTVLPESTRVAQSARFAAMHHLYFGQRPLSGAHLAALTILGRRSGAESPEAMYWRDRLLSEAPHQPVAVIDRVLELLRAPGHIQSRLRQLESLWHEVGAAQEFLPQQALTLARRSGDTPTMMRWIRRVEEAYPWTQFANAMRLIERSATRESGIDRLRGLLVRLDNPVPATRDLTHTGADATRIGDSRRRSIAHGLGRALMAGGNTNAGIDTLEMAAAYGWDESVFRSLANAHLTVGDSVEAAANLAHVMIDPGLDRSGVDSLQELAAQLVDGATLQRLVQQATVQMRRVVGAESENTIIPLGISLRDADGQPTTMASAIGTHATLVAFWSRYCKPSLDDLPALSAVADRFRTRGFSVMAITAEGFGSGAATFLAERGIAVPVFHDVDGEAAAAFNAWATPRYFVLDDRGRIRFSNSVIATVERQAVVIAGGNVIFVDDAGAQLPES